MFKWHKTSVERLLVQKN